MTVHPTRDEWLAARNRVRLALPAEHYTVMETVVNATTEAALGPCPPPPDQIIDRLATWIEQNHQGVSVSRQTGLVVT